ncbi:MAG TPA: phenylalanine--tRNA ligase beta subunit-related protein [Bacillota bacterium]
MSTLSLTVEPAVFERFPGIRVVMVIATGIDARRPRQELSARLAAAWSSAGQAALDAGSPQAHPRIRPWRKALSAQGFPGDKFPCSVEAMMRRARRGGPPPFINPLVDFYNAVSLERLIPGGGWDLKALEGDLALRLTRPGETFLALDAQEPVPVSAGETSYADARDLLTRHLAWRQSRKALLQADTRHAVLVAEFLPNPETGDDPDGVAEEMAAAFREGLEGYFGAVTVAGVVSPDHPALSLPHPPGRVDGN